MRSASVPTTLIPAKALSPLLLLTVLAAAGCSARPVTITMSRDEIQRRVEAKFPLKQEILFSKVTFENPRVLLREGSDRIGLDLRFRVQAPLLPEYGGGLAATGKLAYRREEKAFYLTEPAIERLQVDGLRPEHSAMVQKPAEAAASAVLETIPVYRLDGSDLKEVGARHLLKDVSVRDGRVYATLALSSGR